MTGVSIDDDALPVSAPQAAPGAVAPRPDGALGPLRIPPFRRLAGAYVVNELGNWLGDIALAVLVFDRTGSPLATAALFVGTRFVPALLAPAFTARVEHLDERRVLPMLYALEAVVFVALAAMDWRFVFPLVIALATIDGALALTAKALTRAATAAALTPAGELRRGNALLNVGFTGAGAVGPILAGVVVALLSPGVALLFDAGSFLAVAGMLRGLPARIPAAALGESWRGRLRGGLRYAWSSILVRWLLLGHGSALLFFTLVVPVEVVYAKETLHAGSGGYGALLGAWGAGMVAGGLLFTRADRVRLPLLLGASVTAVGAGYLGMAAAPGLGWASAASALGGVGNGVELVALITALQVAIAPAFQARVMALFEGVSALIPGVGFLLGGVLAELTSARTAFLVAGVGVLCVVLVGAALAVAGSRRAPTLPYTGVSAENASSRGT